MSEEKYKELVCNTINGKLSVGDTRIMAQSFTLADPQAPPQKREEAEAKVQQTFVANKALREVGEKVGCTLKPGF